MNKNIIYGGIAFLLIIILYFLFVRKTSFYDTKMFPDSMTEDDAMKVVESETQRISKEYTDKLNTVYTADEKNTLMQKMNDEITKIANDYNEFMIKKSTQVS